MGEWEIGPLLRPPSAGKSADGAMVGAVGVNEAPYLSDSRIVRVSGLKLAHSCCICAHALSMTDGGSAPPFDGLLPAFRARRKRRTATAPAAPRRRGMIDSPSSAGLGSGPPPVTAGLALAGEDRLVLLAILGLGRGFGSSAPATLPFDGPAVSLSWPFGASRCRTSAPGSDGGAGLSLALGVGTGATVGGDFRGRPGFRLGGSGLLPSVVITVFSSVIGSPCS